MERGAGRTESESHQELMRSAIERDGAGQRALLAGDTAGARAAFAQAAERYRRSWEAAPPGSYGRLVGMLKSAILAGGGGEQAAYARRALAGRPSHSPTASYALALAALIAGEDELALSAAERMRDGSGAFDRAAAAITALAGRDREAFARAIAEIVRDFEQRADHLTGVPIADTALVLQLLAARWGMPAAIESPLMPPA